MKQETCGLPVLSVKVLIMACGSVSSSMTKEWMTAGSSPKKGSSVFGAWPLTTGKKIAEKPEDVE